MNPVIKNVTLPVNWSWSKAQDCMDVRDGTHDSPKFISEGYPLVTSKNLVNGEIDFSTCSYISKADHDAISNRSAVDDGDLLYAMIGTIGNPVIVEKQFEFSIKNVALFKFKEKKVLNKYIYYFLGSSLTKRQFERNSRGGTQKFVSLGNIRELMIPLPPISEQQKIAEILDAADALRQKDQQLIDHYTALSQSLFLDMFGDPVSNPMGWKIEPFDYFAVIDTKMTSDFEHFADVPHIGVANIEKQTGKLINYNLVKNENLISGKYIFTSEHIIYSKIRPVLNKVALPDFSGLASADSYPILVNRNNSNKIFFANILRSNLFLDYISKHSNRTNIPKANKAQLKQFEAIAPPLELQNKFAERIAIIEKQKQQAQASLEQSNNLFNSLLQKAFTGELTQK